MIGLFEDRAYNIARMRLRKLSPASMCGSLEIKPSMFSEPSIGLANMPVLTLLFRSAIGYVETPSKSSGLMGYWESTLNPWGRCQGITGDRPARTGYVRATCVFPEYEASGGLVRETALPRDPSFSRRS